MKKALLSILIVLSMLLSSFAFVGCSDEVSSDQGGAEHTHSYVDGECECGAKKYTATVNGASLEEYTIVYSEDSDYAMRAAEYIKKSAFERIGAELTVCKASLDSGEGRAILVGETGRALSDSLDAECEGVEFAIGSDGDDIALEGEAFVIAAAAYYFVEEYIPAGRDSTSEISGEAVLEPIKKDAKNFILMIGDGMGEMQTKMFDYLDDTSEISDGESAFYGYMLPYFGYSVTNSLTGITDSAAAATAMATGYKTYNKYVGLDGDKNVRKSLTELALELSMGAAVISTETQTGATPAAFSSHVEDRSNSSEIRAQQNNLVNTAGLVIDGNYSQFTANIMKGIERDLMEALEKIDGENGFFMMYEEAFIDKNCANGNIDNAFLSVIRFNQIIGRVMEFAFYNPDTMVIITADHETGDLSVGDDGKLVLNSEDHTSKNVPIFAYGVGAEIFDGKVMENVNIPMIIAELWGVGDFGDPNMRPVTE